MKAVLLSIWMFCCIPLWSQLDIHLDIDFNAQFGQEYVPLEEFTDLTEGLGAWGYFNFWELELMTPLVMPGFEDRPMKFIEVGGYGGLYIGYDDWPEDPYELFLFAFGLDQFVLSPLNDENNTDQGHILFYQGDEVVIVEYLNVAFEEEMYSGDGSLVSRANFQIELHLDDLCVQFNYGSSTLSTVMQEYLLENMVVGTGLGWHYEEFIDGNWEEDYLDLVGFISGDPNDPQFHQMWVDMDFDEDEVEYLNAFPDEGTVYRFCYNETTSVHELSAGESALRLFPNPASTELFVDLYDSDSGASSPYVVQIVDIHGKLIMEEQSSVGQALNIENLRPGMYFVRVTSNGSSETAKLVIQ